MSVTTVFLNWPSRSRLRRLLPLPPFRFGRISREAPATVLLLAPRLLPGRPPVLTDATKLEPPAN